MDLFLLHFLILTWASVGLARRLYPGVAERLLSAALLTWGNLVVSGLLLSVFHRLDSPGWFFSASLLLAVLAGLLVSRVPGGNPSEDPTLPAPVARSNPWLLAAFTLTFVPAFCATAAAAYAYEPNNHEAMAYQLPRVAYYLGQGNLAHFDAADFRQICLPFNYNLLQLFAFTYNPPLQCLNLFNVIAWALGGLAVYRLCRLCALGANASLVTCWLVLIAPPVLAQAGTTTPDLPVGLALVGAAIFALRWQQTRRTRHAMLAALALGLAAGSDLTAFVFVVAAGLTYLVWRYRSRGTREMPPRRTWILATLLAGFLALPFALLNLTVKGPGTLEIFALRSHNPTSPGTPGLPDQFLPLLSKTAPLLTLNEDIIAYGPIGLLFLVSAVIGVLRPWKSRNIFTWLGIGWALVFVLLHGASLPKPRELIPAVLFLGPGLATLVEMAGARRPGPRYGWGLLLAIMALLTGWSSAVYLLKNTSRPLAPLLNATFLPPAMPSLSLVFTYQFAGQTRFNIDSDATDEAIFPFLALRRGQRFSSRRQIVPEAYNLLSRAERSRNSRYEKWNPRPVYTQVAIETKHSAGVEFLATVGRGPSARDYFGVIANAGQVKPTSNNRTLLATLYPDPSSRDASLAARLQLEGLNPADEARVVVTLKSEDGHLTPAATFLGNGVASLPLAPSSRWVFLTATDLASGKEIGSSAIELAYVKEPPPARPLPSRLPGGSNLVFLNDVVTDPDVWPLTVAGLLPVEGPFPQWDLPLLRWAREPSARIIIPPTPDFGRLQLTFSVRLHVRNRASLEVRFNGVVVKHYLIEDRTAWLDQTLTLSPRPGVNVVEFRDGPVTDEPDWLDYVDRYPDVKKYLVESHIPLQSGAREHYETNGRAEGRTLHTVGKPEPAPDSYYFMFRNIRLEGFKSP